MDTGKVREEFEAKKSLFMNIEEVALRILGREIKRAMVKVHILNSRIKKIDSLLDKMRRKQIKEPFTEICDIVGLRVVCLFRSDIKRISDLVKKSFRVIHEDDKTQHADPRVFEYEGVHFTAKLKEADFMSEVNPIGDVPFEIQVRTIGQDAWAAVSHHLDYKSERGLPDSLRRDFNALIGLFHVADNQFEAVRRSQMAVIGIGDWQLPTEPDVK